MILKKGIIGLLILIFLAQIGAEEPEKPVVAVVLAGGGALGFSHVGALEVLEEEGIRPDIVIGTSIGSIIGGLYCVGYSAEELESIILETDWKYTLTDSFSRRKLSFEQKKRQSEYYLSIEAKEKNRVEDAGLSHAQHVVELLDRLLAPYSTERDFDSLPVRFRAVGADLLTGDRIVYGEGDLKTAIRASMAVPGVFTPVSYKGRYVIDGGWVDNLPTTVAKELGADIIIAVSLFSMEENIDELVSLPAILSQADQIRTIERNKKSLEAADLIISPDLTGYGMADFEYGRSLMNLGYDAASGQREEIRALAASLGEPSPKPVRRTYDDKVGISRVIVNAGENERVVEKLELSLTEEFAGRDIAVSALRDYLYSIYDTGEYTHVWYQLVPEGNGKYKLVVDAPPQMRALELFSASIDFSGQIIDSSIFDITLKTAYQSWLGEDDFNTSASFELWLSEFPSVLASLDHHPLGMDVHLNTKGYLLQSSQYFFSDDTVESLYTLSHAGGSFSLEQPFFRRMELILGLFSEYDWMDHRLGEKFLEEDSWFRYGARGIISLDTRDRAIAPERGVNAAIFVESSWNEEGEPVAKALVAGEWYASLTDGLILITGLEAQSLLKGELNPVELPTSGNMIENHGYYPQELRGDNVGLFSLSLRKQIGTLPLGLGDEIYLQLSGNTATTWDDEVVSRYEDFEFYRGGALGFVINSVIGELQLNGEINRDGRWSVFLGLSTSTSFFSEYD